METIGEQNTNDKKAVKKETSKKTSVLKKLDVDAAKTLASLKERVNKKSYGRSVRDSEILHMGLKLIEAQHINELQEATYSEKDRLGLAHEEYQKTNGKLSLEQFIGKLLKGEIKPQ